MRRIPLSTLGLAFFVACSPQISPPPSAPSVAATEAAAALPAAASALPATPPIASGDPAIAAASKAYVAFVVATSPEAATVLGIHTRDTELDDRTMAAESAYLAQAETLLREARALAMRPNLSRSDRTDASILVHTLEVEIRTRKDERPLERQPSLYTSPLEALFVMMARDYAPAKERARSALSRMETIPVVVGAAKVNLKSPPRVWTQVAIERAEGAAAFFDEQRGPLEAALPEEKARIDRALKTAKAAYADYKKFLEKVVLPRSKGDFAAGRAMFDFLLKNAYFLDEDADAVLALGERLLTQTEAQMTEVARRIDPKAKGWPEVVAKVKGNHPTAADLLPSYRRELTRARAFLVEKDAVPFPPGDDCQVLETPPFQRTTITAAYDEPPPFDTSTKGFFYVTPVETSFSLAKQESMLRENDHGDQVDTAVHEAYPGHHLQLSFARLHPSLIRKVTGPSIFSEGWGLYAEELMAELGYYTDEERLMQLEWTLVRAARVVIDVGLHTRGMSFDAALKVLTDKVQLERPLALSEIKRYTMSPTQPLSYLVGREMLFKLRDRYRTREGGTFTLKRFHAEALSHGTIAPGLLAQEMFEP